MLITLLLRTHKKVKICVEKAYITLENIYIIVNGLLGKIEALKALLLREQKEIKYILLEIGGKRIPVIKWQKFYRIYKINTWKPKFINGELEYLEEIYQ